MWLMEQPLTIVCAGVVLVAVLQAALVQTGRHGFLYATITVVLLTVGLVGVERAVITPREEVKATLHLIVHDLEKNDVSAVLTHVSRGRPELGREAKQKIQSIEILDVDIKRNLKIEIVQERGIQIAEAKFNATIRFRFVNRLRDEARPFPLFFTVRLRKEDDGKWRVRNYEMSDPRTGIGT